MELNDKNFQETLTNNAGIPTLVYFGADWCGPCKVMKPIIAELEIEFAEQYLFAKIDVDESPETTSNFGIRNIPAMLIIKY
jgi:thioredoxin 1